MIDRDLAHDLMNRLVTESQKEMTLHFELRPLEAYLLTSLVGLAVIHPECPENPKEFGDKFIKAFCDRYREELPAMVQSFELADHENFLMTKDEFDDLTSSGDTSEEVTPDWAKLLDPDQHDLEVKALLSGIKDWEELYTDDFE